MCRKYKYAVQWSTFLSFKLDTTISSFRYLAHIVRDTWCDNDDIPREIKNLFIRTNTLIRKFNKCSIMVKYALFRSYCLIYLCMTVHCGMYFDMY